MRDVRFAMRGFRRSPTFTVTAVLILGLGMGMAVAMWTVLHAVLIQPLPVRDVGQLVLLRAMDQAGVELALGKKDVDAIRAASRTLRDVSSYGHVGVYQWPLMDGDQSLTLNGAQTDGRFFDLLGARAVLGRLFRPEDDTASRVIVLSYGTWQRVFAGDPGIVGHRLTQPFGDYKFTIIGVAPPGLDFPVGADYWEVPPFWQGQDVIARLAPGASAAAARSEFLALERRIASEQPATVDISRADVRTLTTAIVGDVRPVLVLLMAAVGLLLVIACVNVGNLLLLRASSRSRELAIRRALGATYGAIVRQMLVESALLALGGGALGLVCAEAARHILVLTAPARLPRLDAVRLSGLPIGATVVAVLVSMLFFGVLPALTAARRGGGTSNGLGVRTGSVTRQQRRVRHTLVASQVALALIMLAGAGLLVRTVRKLDTLDLGYQTDHLAIVGLSLNFFDFPDPEARATLADALHTRIRAIPGVTALTPIIVPPYMGQNVWAGVWQADWQTPAEAAKSPTISIESCGPEYFRAFGIPLVHGRGFVETDDAHAPQVAIVSAAVAQRYWPGQDPIGKRIRLTWEDSVNWRTVVGVAAESHLRTLREATPVIYLPWRQHVWQGTLAIRTIGDPRSLLPAIRRTVHAADPRVSIWRVHTMDDYIAVPLAQPRLSALLLSGFGLVALLLAAIGLYGIMASAVRDQTREIGVRMALGATPGRLRRDVLGRALVVTGAGAAVGVVVALATSHLLAALLFEVAPTDPIALSGASLLLLAVALVAAYVPAQRATKIEAASALRAE